MATIHLDLNTRVILPEREVFVTRPGKGYRLYPALIRSRSVVAELPGLDLVQGRPLGEHKDLNLRIARARALRAWHRHGAEKGKRPSDSLSSYSEKATEKSVAGLRVILSGYFEKLKRGDLVVVPPSAFSRETYIGEVVSEPTKYESVTAPQFYGNDALPGRRVRWLAQIEKRKLPSEILDALEHPTSIYLLARSQRPAIYAAAFGTYVDASRPDSEFIARFSIAEDGFTTETDLRLQAFFNFVAANYLAAETNGSVKRLIDVLFQELGDAAPELRTNVNSPGHVDLVAKSIVPLVAAALFALAVNVGRSAPEAAEANKIVIGNSKAGPDDECTALVRAATLTQLKMLRLSEWPQACELAKLVAEQAGVTATVNTEKKP